MRVIIHVSGTVELHLITHDIVGGCYYLSDFLSVFRGRNNRLIRQVDFSKTFDNISLAQPCNSLLRRLR